MFFLSDPPLEEQDIPHGEWVCHSCKHAARTTTTTTSTAQLRSKRSNSTPAPKTVSPKKAKPTGMDLLIEAAEAMNPKQFELPRSMSVPCNFPGTDKGKWFLYN